MRTLFITMLLGGLSACSLYSSDPTTKHHPHPGVDAPTQPPVDVYPMYPDAAIPHDDAQPSYPDAQPWYPDAAEVDAGCHGGVDAGEITVDGGIEVDAADYGLPDAAI